MNKAIVAVSGGSDSLALLDILYKKGEYELLVCHVNYNYRESSLSDQKKVEKYCKEKNLPCFILNLNSKEIKEGNFENWARVKRYKFFKEIYDLNNCDCLFVGHQRDDLLETYLLQKRRGAIVETYGLAKEVEIQGMKVIRPLLNYSKKTLEAYCKENNLDYGIDETNFDLSYKRNAIRHEIIAKLSEEEIEKLLKEIKQANQKRSKEVKKVKQLKKDCLLKENQIDLLKFNELNEDEKKGVLYYFLIDNLYKKLSISNARLLDMIKKIESNKPNIILANYGEYTLYKEYKLLVIDKNKKEYVYEIKDLKQKEIGEGFFIASEGRALEEVIASKEEFPLYLKNYDGSNKIINRLFINKKIPLRLRKSWPVIVNKIGGLLLVIGIKKFYNKRDFIGESYKFYVCKEKGE